MALLRRPPVGGSGSSGASGSPSSCKWAQNYPALWEFLTLCHWEGTEVRTPGTLLLCWGEGRFRLWLHDKDSQRSAWLSAETMTELLATAEKRLTADNLEWRAEKGGASKRR